jgi:hypothetical protein
MHTSLPIVVADPSITDTETPEVFGNVIPMDPQLFSKINKYAATLLEGQILPEYSPLEVAQWLEDMADISDRKLAEAESLVKDVSNVDFRRFYHDIRIQNGIARFYSMKMRAAVLWHLYEGSDDLTALEKAIEKYTIARDAWAEMAEEAKMVYVEDITFGSWEIERGNWADRIPAIDADITDMKEELANAKEEGKKANNPEVVKQAIRIVETQPIRVLADCRHTPADLFTPGEPMEIELGVEATKTNEVYLHYRHVNQALYWQKTSMKRKGENFQAVIPAQYTQTRYPMEYYFTVEMGEEGIAIYPGLDENLANMPYYVVRQKVIN